MGQVMQTGVPIEIGAVYSDVELQSLTVEGQRVYAAGRCVRCGATYPRLPLVTLAEERFHCPSCSSSLSEARSTATASAPARLHEGTRFGEWTVLRDDDEALPFSRRRVQCRCACGAEHDVLASNLHNGRSTRCRACAPAARAASRTGAREPRNIAAGRAFMRAVYVGCTDPASALWRVLGGQGVTFEFASLNDAFEWIDAHARPGRMAQFVRVDKGGPIAPANLQVSYTPLPPMEASTDA